MGEIKIDIPKDMEAAFEEAFPDEDKAAAVLHLIEAEIARRQDAEAAAEGSLEGLLDVVGDGKVHGGHGGRFRC